MANVKYLPTLDGAANVTPSLFFFPCWATNYLAKAKPVILTYLL